MVTGAGLIGEYYKNETSFKNYMPDYVVSSERISFNNRRLDDNRLFSYARWMGYLSFPHTATFHIEIVGIEGKCKLVIGDAVVFDTDKDSSIGSFRAYEHVLYEMFQYCVTRYLIVWPFLGALPFSTVLQSECKRSRSRKARQSFHNLLKIVFHT